MREPYNAVQYKKGGASVSFRVKMKEVSEARRSNIVLALDFPSEVHEKRGELFLKAKRVLEATYPYICAVKINHHLVLPLGLFDGVQELIEMAHDAGLMTIMDCKANDIGSTNQVIAEYYYTAGFDALTANPFIGWEDGLKPIFDIAHELNRGVILLVYMSHKGAAEGYGQVIVELETGERVPQYVSFARKAMKYGADGVIVGATSPEKVREVYEVLDGKIPIYSPGIGVQGGDAKAAIEAGASYLIVGRSITQSRDPAEAARQIRELANR